MTPGFVSNIAFSDDQTYCIKARTRVSSTDVVVLDIAQLQAHTCEANSARRRMYRLNYSSVSLMLLSTTNKCLKGQSVTSSTDF